MITIIPAIDMIGGECVRLTQGDYDRKTSYYKDPLEVALRYANCGIRRLHLVDLDGAKAAHPVNLNVLERITVSTSLQVQYGGGIKNAEALRDVFGSGATRAICGSIAVTQPDAFREWLAAYEAASADPEQKELRKQKKPNALDRLEFEMENGLVLQGATAIEDSLQEGVPEALAQLSDAGIHVWMITGDKVGTAKNIAVACNLLKLPEMKLVEFTKEAVDATLLSKAARAEDLTEKISP